ncbi:hypothetical protein ACROAG_09525 [Shewanella oncorhynchi]|uniref:hypothetical protein n=1 Tax=Shewanella oncorhynchi TaxID=2726434 RepID=UPI003D7B73DA
MKLAMPLAILFTPITQAQDLFAESAKSTVNDALASPFLLEVFIPIVIIALAFYAFKK